MKRQLEHQSSAPHNISTWDTGQSLMTFLYPIMAPWGDIWTYSSKEKLYLQKPNKVNIPHWPHSAPDNWIVPKTLLFFFLITDVLPFQGPQRPACSRPQAQSACLSRRPKSSLMSSPPPCPTGKLTNQMAAALVVEQVVITLGPAWFISMRCPQVSGLCGRAGGVRRGDSRPGCCGSLHVHPPQPWFGSADAPRHHAVCGQVQLLLQPTSTQHFTFKWSFITHTQSSCIIHPQALIHCFNFSFRLASSANFSGQAERCETFKSLSSAFTVLVAVFNDTCEVRRQVQAQTLSLWCFLQYVDPGERSGCSKAVPPLCVSPAGA